MAEYCHEGHESHQIATLVSQNIDSIKVLLSSLAPHEDHYSKAASQLARFKLWAGSFGAHRRSGRRSLDHRLRDSSSIRQHVIRLLEQLREAIKDALSSSNNSEATVGEACGLMDPELIKYLVDDDESNQSNLDIALVDISHVVDCMLCLSVAITNPAPHDQFLSRAGLETLVRYEKYDKRHVQEKFTRIEDRLAERLGAAITARRHFFKYREDHHAGLSSGMDDNDGLAENGDQTTQASSVPEHLKDTLDEDARSGTSYAQSSYSVDELKVPPIPKEHHAGSFLCPLCYLTVDINSTIDWERHVMRDLKPYICLAPHCLAQYHKFSRRSDWSHHMEQVHWRLWRCSYGCQGAYDNAEEFRSHLRTAHSNDLTLQQQDILEQMCSEADLDKAVGPCPLCFEVHIDDDIEYYTHVGHHLEQLALSAVPQIENEDDKTGNQNDGMEMKNIGQDPRGLNSINAGPKSDDEAQTQPENLLEHLSEENSQFQDSPGVGMSVLPPMPVGNPIAPFAPSRQQQQAFPFSVEDNQFQNESGRAAPAPPLPRRIQNPMVPAVPLRRQQRTFRPTSQSSYNYSIGEPKGDRAKWRWNCCNCSFPNLSYNYDVNCPSCQHRRDVHCRIWAE